MSRVEYKLEGHVAILTMNNGENRLNPDFLSDFNKVLDEIENSTEASVLIVTSAHDKIFSNGIDLDWLVPLLNTGDIKTTKAFIYQLMAFYKRILTSPLITIAAMNGHAFAGGAILCCYFDYRFMRSDRGFFCFPEVDLGIPFLPGMITAMKTVIPNSALSDMVLEGKRMSGLECEKLGIVKKACPVEELLPSALNYAKTLQKRRAVISIMKSDLYKEIISAFDNEDPLVIESGRFYV